MRLVRAGPCLCDGPVAPYDGGRAGRALLNQLQLQVDAVEQPRPAPRDHGMYDERVLVDEPHRGERSREPHPNERDPPPAASQPSDDVALDQFGVPVDNVEGSGCHDPPHRIHHLGERDLTVVRPFGPLPSRVGATHFHQLVNDTAVPEGVGPARLVSPERHGFRVRREAGFVVETAVQGGVRRVAGGGGAWHSFLACVRPRKRVASSSASRHKCCSRRHTRSYSVELRRHIKLGWWR